MTREVNTAREVDWLAVSLYLGLVLTGWLMIYAVGSTSEHPPIFDLSSRHGTQLLWIGVAIALGTVTMIVDSKFYRTFAYPIYLIAILLLVYVLVAGRVVSGSLSWFDLGFFRFQPSETAKFATCLALASFLGAYNSNLQNFKTRMTALAVVGAPMFLVLLQGDAGSALVFSSLLLVLFREGMPLPIYIWSITIGTLSVLSLMFPAFEVILGLIMAASGVLVYGFPHRMYNLLGYLVIVLGSFLVARQGYLVETIVFHVLLFLVLLIFRLQLQQGKKKQWAYFLTIGLVIGSIYTFTVNYSFNNFLKPHQQDRVNVWLNPSKCDPLGALYNVTWSKLAIGSGGFSGKGYLQGTITKLNYVPEQATDFIFCTIGEEQGFLGVFAIVMLFLLFLMRILIIAERQRSKFTRVYAYGVASILFFHLFVNVGMTMGLVPVIGIPLPFISYGGSSLLAFTVLVGILLRLDADRLTSFR